MIRWGQEAATPVLAQGTQSTSTPDKPDHSRLTLPYMPLRRSSSANTIVALYPCWDVSGPADRSRAD